MKRALSLYAAAAFAFLYLPLAVLSAFSFNDSRFTLWTGFSLRWYRAAFADADLLEAALNSLLIASAATITATIIGTLAAYALWQRRSRTLAPVLYLSLLTPEIVMGVSLLAFYQWIFRSLALPLGFLTVVLAHVMFSIAYVVLVILARLRLIDKSLEEAALDLGATPWDSFRLVTLPQLRPAILAAALLVFTVSFDDYVITSMVAGVDSQTLPLIIYAMARRGANPIVNAVSTLIIVALGIFILLSQRLRQS